MRAVAVIGNPKPASRTRKAAELLADGLGADCTTLELSQLGPGLLGWGDPVVAEAVAAVQKADIVIAASPTFKATYSGLLKLFLDQFSGGTGLAGVVGIPLMLGAGDAHALAPDLLLKPVLVELGATCPAQGLFQLDSAFADDGRREQWLTSWGPVVRHVAGRTA
jgi:FMN reductase